MAKCKPKKDCLKFPIPPKCFKFCIEQILRVARPADKIEVLGMNENLAEAIFRAYNYGPRIRSFDDLAKSLNTSQVEQIINIFENMSQSQLDFFSRKF